jgi:hypothetical protein
VCDYPDRFSLSLDRDSRPDKPVPGRLPAITPRTLFTGDSTMTRKELIQALQAGDQNGEVMIAGHRINSIDLVPAEGRHAGYFDIVGQ